MIRSRYHRLAGGASSSQDESCAASGVASSSHDALSRPKKNMNTPTNRRSSTRAAAWARPAAGFCPGCGTPLRLKSHLSQRGDAVRHGRQRICDASSVWYPRPAADAARPVPSGIRRCRDAQYARFTDSGRAACSIPSPAAALAVAVSRASVAASARPAATRARSPAMSRSRPASATIPSTIQITIPSLYSTQSRRTGLKTPSTNVSSSAST